MINAKVLVVDDDQDVLLAARMLLKQHFLEVQVEKDPACLPTLMAHHACSIDYLTSLFSLLFSMGRRWH